MVLSVMGWLLPNDWSDIEMRRQWRRFLQSEYFSDDFG